MLMINRLLGRGAFEVVSILGTVMPASMAGHSPPAGMDNSTL
jgi:hypothetical protein